MRRALMLAGALLLGAASGLLLFIALGWRPDYSTPRAAARTFYIAIMTGDLDTARESVCDARQAELLEDLREMVQSVLAARQAAITRFGEPGQRVSGGLPSLEELGQADEQVRGDAAALVCADPDTLRIRLKRGAQQWKVDLLATFSLDEMDQPLARKVLQLARQSIAEHARNIEAGRYDSPQEADAALRSALAQAMIAARLGQLLTW
jgi:hypothetical protein